jgi:hypothetical protein
MKKNISLAIGLLLAAFGLLTLFLSSSVIFDLFGIRAREGNYVLFIVWANFIASFIYLFSAYGFVKSKAWTTSILSIASVILLVAFLGLMIWVYKGGIHETKTIAAMIFRITVTMGFTALAYYTINKKNIKMKTKILPLIAGTFILFSCGNATNDKTSVQTDSTVHEQHHEAAVSSALELNNGEKWAVNTEMMVHVLSMENELNSFAGTGLSDYQGLAAKLQQYNDQIISSCTMKDKAHEELHKWLLPYIDSVKELSEAKDETTASAQLLKVKKSFAQFNEYFQ